MTTFTSEQLNNMSFNELFDVFGQGYKDMLNGDDTVIVAGAEYEAAEVLEAVDPIAFREGFFDYVDSLIED